MKSKSEGIGHPQAAAAAARGGGDGDEKEHDTAVFHSAGFTTQLFATIRRQLIQKRRMWISTLLELLLPVAFVMGLVAIALVSPKEDVPAKQYVSPSGAWDVGMELRTSILCYDPSSAHADLRLVLQPCPNITAPENTCFAPTFDTPLEGLCLQVPPSAAVSFISSFQNNERDVVVPDMDDYLLFKWATNALVGSSDSIFSGGFTRARQTGKLFVMPPTGEGPAYVEYMNRTFVLFKHSFGGYFNSREEYVPFIKSLQNEGKVWAVLGIDAVETAKHTLEYTIAMNTSAQPYVQSSKRLVDTSSYGLGGRNYAKSTVSGALTLQKSVNEYFMLDVLHESLGENNSSSNLNSPGGSKLVVAPMPVTSYVRHQFLQIGSAMGPLLLVLAFLYPVSQLSKRLVEEKEQRLREGTMIMGLGKAAFFSSWLLVYYVQMFFLSILIAAILKAGVATQSDYFLIWVAYLLFSFTTINLAALLSTFFSKAKIAALCVPLLYFVFAIPAFAIPDSAGAGPAVSLSFLCPVPFSVALKLTFKHEINRGLGWNGAASSTDEPYNFAVCMVWFIVDFFLYIGLLLYFDNVLPKEWGTRLNPCYCFCCCCNGRKFHEEGIVVGGAVVDPDACDNARNHMRPELAHRSIQDYPRPNRESSVHIRGLRKEFEGANGKVNVAVDGMELRMFPDSITVFLGHNGAGKTTVMNMMTGMMSPTAGDVTIYGNSILSNMQAIRRDIGFCPQHNILWDDLTCFEHLQYFARLKGMRGADVDAEAIEMLTKVDLLDKRDVFSCNLSGGQKRKLSVAIAFMGRARLVLLDEPTAGMDVAARRHTWDVLKEMSQGRTILLTTHFMDEADLLGNRIAIMSKGSLHSYGTSTFLKNSLGAGYSMKIASTEHVADSERILAQIRTMMPQAFVREAKGQEVAIALPKDEVRRFPSVIRMMERADVKANLKIASVSMSATGLEEVFLAIAHQEELEGANEYASPLLNNTTYNDNQQPEADPVAAVSALERVYSRIQSKERGSSGEAKKSEVARQLGAMVRKRVNHGRRDRCAICLQIIAPILCILLAMGLSKIGTDLEPKATSYSNDAYDLSGGLTVSLGDCQHIAGFMDADFKKVDSRTSFDNASAFSSYLLDTADSNGDMYRLVSFACDGSSSSANNTNATTNTTTTTVIFANATGLIAAPQGLTQLYSANLRAKVGSATAGFKVRQWPFPNTERQTTEIESISATMMALFILIPYTFIPSTYVAYVVRERECKSKHLQFVSGASYAAYWLGNFIFDFVSYLATVVVSFVLFAVFGQDWAVGSPDAAMGTFVLFVLYGLSGIGFAYLVSFLFSNHSTAQTVIMMVNFLVGFVLVLLMYFLRNIDSTKDAADVIVFFLRIVPPFALGDGLFLTVMAGAMAPVQGEKSVFSVDVAGYNMLYMGLLSVGFLVATMFIDHPSRARRRAMLSFSSYSTAPTVADEDEDVASERKEVEGGMRPNDVVQVQGLRREFDLGGGKKKVAVQNITFGVKPGEVFGFLGTNGAGKTTTMSMLTTEIIPTCGSGRIGGYDIVQESDMTRRLIGYCPQFDAIMDLLTPAEHLALFAALRGIPAEETDAVIEALIESCALQKYRDIPAGRLSGGNKRKLSVAMALIGGPSIVFLDEPSAGMDPHARRQMWDVIIFVAKHSSVVLTTHHLEEVDVLAHRVGIMDAGLMKCLGSLEHLKMKFGNGFELTLQINEGSLDAVTKLIASRYPTAVLVEARQQRVLYTLPFDSTDLASLFETIQRAKDDPSVGITDYTVQQTSLEQVFLRISNEESEAKVISSDVTNRNGDGLGVLVPIESPIVPRVAAGDRESIIRGRENSDDELFFRRSYGAAIFDSKNKRRPASPSLAVDECNSSTSYGYGK